MKSVVGKRAIVPITIGPDFNTLPVAFTLQPGPLITSPGRPDLAALSMWFAIDEFAGISVTIGKCCCTLAMEIPVQEVTRILISVQPFSGAIALHDALHKLSGVFAVVCKHSGALSVELAIDKIADIFIP